ncbi:MAG: hypothetical protein ACK5LM_04555 [Lactovum sp.]
MITPRRIIPTPDEIHIIASQIEVMSLQGGLNGATRENNEKLVVEMQEQLSKKIAELSSAQKNNDLEQRQMELLEEIKKLQSEIDDQKKSSKSEEADTVVKFDVRSINNENDNKEKTIESVIETKKNDLNNLSMVL